VYRRLDSLLNAFLPHFNKFLAALLQGFRFGLRLIDQCFGLCASVLDGLRHLVSELEALILEQVTSLLA